MITNRGVAAKFLIMISAVLLLIAGLLGGRTAAGAQPTRPPTYTNAVSDSFSDTFADPSIIQAKDGFTYAYATADPLRSGDQPGLIHIARTKDFVHWEYRGTVFSSTNRPSYATPGAGLWAPDIRYIDGRYVLYFAVTDTALNASGSDNAIGVATAPRPDGPWTAADEPIIKPRLRPGTSDYLGTIDPAGFTDVDGQHYLYFGGYNGGIWAAKVSADGLTADTDYTQVTIDNRYEGGYLIRHDGWYYFMGSVANCCAGPTTGYSVYAGRSRSPLGPFVDQDGQSLMDPYVGGTNVIMQNGNRYIGPGHNAIATDAEGRTWIVYHAIDRNNPWLNAPFGINRRPMLIDRIDWIDGWPRTRAGAGPSDTPQEPPVTTSGLGITADDPAAGGVRGLTAGPDDDQAGPTAALAGSARTDKPAPAGSVRVRFDLKTAQPVTVQLGNRSNQVTTTVDPAAGRLSVTTTSHGHRRTDSADLAGWDSGWHTVSVQVDRHTVQAWAGESDLADPAAEVRISDDLALPAAPVSFTGNGLLDNLTVRPVARQTTRPVATPRTGKLLADEEFSDSDLAGWTWVRPDADASVTGGQFVFPVQSGDLSGDDVDASVLLHDPPTTKGDWIVETKLDLDLGRDEVRNYQQAGLVAYRNDDDFARLDKVAIWNTRQVEFGRQLVATDDGRTAWGGSIQARPAQGPTWLRLAYHRTADGEHQFRAAVSRDGSRWTWGGVWTFDPGDVPRIGLVAQGGSSPATDARFDYVRFYAAK